MTVLCYEKATLPTALKPLLVKRPEAEQEKRFHLIRHKRQQPARETEEEAR